VSGSRNFGAVGRHLSTSPCSRPLCLRGFGSFYESDNLTYEASIAYYALLSLFPVFLLACAMLGSVTADVANRAAVVDFVLQYFPKQFDFITGQLDALQTNRVSLGIGGTIASCGAHWGVRCDQHSRQARVGRGAAT